MLSKTCGPALRAGAAVALLGLGSCAAYGTGTGYGSDYTSYGYPYGYDYTSGFGYPDYYGYPYGGALLGGVAGGFFLNERFRDHDHFHGPLHAGLQHAAPGGFFGPGRMGFSGGFGGMHGAGFGGMMHAGGFGGMHGGFGGMAHVGGFGGMHAGGFSGGGSRH